MEASHAILAMPPTTGPMTNPAPITLAQLWRHWRGLPHQLAAISELEEELAANGYAATMRRDRPWFETWSQDGKQQLVNPLPVPYFAQLDNGPEGWRQCQTSSIAMCLAFLKTQGIHDDLDYLNVVRRFGDTTSQNAHIEALAYLQARARFRQNMSANDLLSELKDGRPVAIGILHHGPVSAPTGGGHYIVVIGWTDSAWICHDPYGELNLVRGGWAKQGAGGKQVVYSQRNLNPRWLPDGPQSGWGWTFNQ